jgi:hypothetical protein
VKAKELEIKATIKLLRVHKLRMKAAEGTEHRIKAAERSVKIMNTQALKKLNVR